MATVRQWGWAINSSGLGLYLLGLALLGGMSLVADQLRADQQRTPVRSAYDQAAQPGDSDLMQPEDVAPTERVSGDPLWTSQIRRVDEALEQEDVSAAQRAWHDAYLAMLGSWSWEGRVEVADAYLRIGEVVGTRKSAEAKARELYVAALFRARAQGSLDGVLRTAGAFAALGDREVVAVCLRIASGLADERNDAQARDRVKAFAGQLAPRSVGG